jgi:hypothetical protein
MGLWLGFTGGGGFIPPDPRGKPSDHHPTVGSMGCWLWQAVGRKGPGRKRVRPLVSAAQRAARAHSGPGPQKASGRIVFSVIF